MKLFDLYILLIILIKICYLVTIILKKMDLSKKTKETVDYYHTKLHVLFYLSMGILLVILFNPFIKEAKVSGHEKIFIFILGVLMIIDIVKRYVKNSSFLNDNNKIETSIHIVNELLEII
jgi:predicted membrane channel-forming protein YqfA (hemolysin III family)